MCFSFSVLRSLPFLWVKYDLIYLILFSVSYAQIDWHDFVVVETVDFAINEVGNFPPPTTPEEVGARLLAQERFESNPIKVLTTWIFRVESTAQCSVAKRQLLVQGTLIYHFTSCLQMLRLYTQRLFSS